MLCAGEKIQSLGNLFYKKSSSFDTIFDSFSPFIPEPKFSDKRMAKLTKLKIKVIKKTALVNNKVSVVTERKLKQRTERQIATNVSGWINDFQHRRREESLRAFSQLFALGN